MSTVLFESVDHISYIYLNRPDRYNALNKEMLTDLLNVVEQVEQNDDRIVIISGKGKAFCAGGDIGMMADFSDKAYYDNVMDTICSIAMKLYMMPKMVIAAVQGSAAGLGLSLALTADYVVANENAKLGMLFLGVGLAPDGGGHFWLQERLGTHKAKQFTWGMEQVKAEEAKKMNLVDVITEEHALDHAALLGQRLLSMPLTSMVKTKMLYHQHQKETLKYFLNEEKNIQWELCHTKDHDEGVDAFLGKRKPIFVGK
ncbi:enoyl-CoA hydratase-related protein [Virgibacillus oceani]|uniref:Enoyl-CoA hydratase/isomerase YhaR n=1 Tax=Virgibacillus oceani TaxID=1479511 RepID=A0A917M961_9BACI|nr:enoyl-CoA hydratase-related protein [Virgibacillus oceani]GGG85645.1 putative enoyl-CoA hydratase/isomerase YhaR [Virgibacillus oceani]